MANDKVCASGSTPTNTILVGLFLVTINEPDCAIGFVFALTVVAGTVVDLGVVATVVLTVVIVVTVVTVVGGPVVVALVATVNAGSIVTGLNRSGSTSDPLLMTMTARVVEVVSNGTADADSVAAATVSTPTILIRNRDEYRFLLRRCSSEEMGTRLFWTFVLRFMPQV
jgi:hypothetical protein